MAKNETTIEWKPIPGFPNYQISNRGDVCLVKIVKRYGNRVQLSDGQSRTINVSKLLRDVFGSVEPLTVAPSVGVLNVSQDRLDESAITPIKPERTNPYSSRNFEMARRREQGQTLKEIGNAFGLTRERVRQITDPIIDRTKADQSKKMSCIERLRAQLQPAYEFIKANPTLSEAERFAPRPSGMSTFSFYKSFRKAFGIGAGVFARQCWIEFVKERITSGAKIGEIAKEMGIENYENLTMKFTRIEGVPPTVWLRSVLTRHTAA